MYIWRDMRLTSVWGLSSAGRSAALWLRVRGSWGNGSPPSRWARRAARGPDCRRASVRTSSRTSPLPDPTSPLRGRNRCPPAPEHTREQNQRSLLSQCSRSALQLFSRWHILLKCDPLCEIQAKVSKSNYEITSIKVWFQLLISLWFQSLTLSRSVNNKDIKVTFSQNGLLSYEGWCYVENSKSQKKRL